MAVVDEYTKLLLHCDGADESTTFTDSSLTPKTVTAKNTAQLDTAQKVFGTASGLFDGDSDYLTVPESADWDFDSGNFTIDLRIRLADITTQSYQIIMSQGEDLNNRWMLYWDKTNGMSFYVTLASSVSLSFSQGAVTGWSTNTWYHVAMIRFGNEWDIYRAGTSIANTTDADDMPNFNAPLVIGQNEWTGTPEANAYFGGGDNGWMDELRVSKGIARWETSFTPPTEAYGTVAAAGGSPMIFSGGVVVG